jgi:hypothetical protein
LKNFHRKEYFFPSFERKELSTPKVVEVLDALIGIFSNIHPLIFECLEMCFSFESKGL